MKQDNYMKTGILLVILMLTLISTIGSSCSRNAFPVISALETQTNIIPPRNSGEINCIATDPDGDKLSYQWSATGGTISGEGSSIVWTAPDAGGTYNVTVVVSDIKDGKASMGLLMNVPGNQPPVITRIYSEPSSVGVGLPGRLSCVASDPEGDRLDYRWKASGGTISGTDDEAIWLAPPEPGKYDITVEVIDNMGASAKMSASVDVLPNHKPVIESLTANPSNVVSGKTSTIECIAYDPDGDELQYDWSVSSGQITDDGPTVNWTAPYNCTLVTVTVQVQDGRGDTIEEDVRITVRSPGG